jgi:hypothetical protein
MSKSVQKGLLAVGVLVASTNVAFADATTITAGFATDVEPVFITAGIIMIGIGAIWAIKKVIALGNKS